MTPWTSAWTVTVLTVGLASAVSAQSLPAGAEFQVNTYTTGDQGYGRPDVGSDGAGNFVVVWDTAEYGSSAASEVFGQRYDSDGVAQGSEFQINTTTTDGQYAPAVKSAPGGNFVVVWTDYNNRVTFQRFNSAGAAQGGEVQVDAVGGSADVAMDAAGKFVIAYQKNNVDGDGQGIFARRFDSDGTALSSAFQVNTYTTDNQRSPGVAMAPSGGFAVVWRSDDQDGDGFGIFAQRFDDTGATAGVEFQVNTYTTGNQRLPGITADGSGNLIVAWRDTDLGSNVAQRYDSNGVPVGTAFLTVGRGGPAVAAALGGDFVVTGNAYDYGDTGVFGQRYDSSGSPVGAVFQVNTYTTGYQVGSAVATNAVGDFVVVWASNGQDGDGYGVFGQRFVACGNGVINPPETCDDGNLVDDDGCSSECEAEGCFACSGEPSTCTAILTCDAMTSDGCCAPGCNDETDIDCFAGQKFQLKDDASKPQKRKIVFKSRSAGINTSPGTGMDLQTDGAYLQIYNNNGTGESVCIPLPASGWDGTPGTVLKYTDKQYVNGPCKKVIAKDGQSLLVKCSAKTQPIDYSLDEAQQVKMGLNFISGSTTYCFTFDGASVVKDEGTVGGGNGQFKALKSPGDQCPVPPSVCPPAGFTGVTSCCTWNQGSTTVCTDMNSLNVNSECPLLSGVHYGPGSECNPVSALCNDTPVATGDGCCQCPASPPFPHSSYCFESTSAAAASACSGGCVFTPGYSCDAATEACVP